MRRLLAIGGLLAVGLVAPLGGEARRCLSKPCARDESGNIKKTPDCCNEVPCELKAKSVDTYAKQQLFSDPFAGKAAIEATNGDRAEAYAALLRIADRRSLRDRACGEFLPEARLMQVDDTNEDCPIVTIDGTRTPMSLEEALRTSDTCEEYVRAEYARMERRRAFCLEFGPASERSFEHLAREAGIEYGAQLSSLNATFRQHERDCTNPPPIEDELVPLTSEIIDELVPLTPDRTPKVKKKSTPKTRPAPKKRSTGGGSR